MLRSVWVLGFFTGGIIGVAGAPAWEMAGLFVGFVGAITGAISAQCAAASAKGLIWAALTILVGSGAMLLLSQQNPWWVIRACTLLVAAGGAAGGVMGFLAGKFLRPLRG